MQSLWYTNCPVNFSFFWSTKFFLVNQIFFWLTKFLFGIPKNFYGLTKFFLVDQIFFWSTKKIRNWPDNWYNIDAAFVGWHLGFVCLAIVGQLVILYFSDYRVAGVVPCTENIPEDEVTKHSHAWIYNDHFNESETGQIGNLGWSLDPYIKCKCISL